MRKTRSSWSKTPSARRLKKRAAPYSETLPLGLRIAAGRQVPPERDEVVLATAGPVQGQHRVGLARVEAVGEPEIPRAHPLTAGTRRGGSTSSSRSRCGSSQGGSFRLSPSRSGSSSAAKPGGSVAISKRTPPGSRK